MIVFPFPTETITTTNPAAIHNNAMTGSMFRGAIGKHALMSVDAHHVTTVPGRYQLGGLAFLAHIFPMTKTGRSERPTLMGVLVSLTPADEIDIEIIRTSNGQKHAHLRGVYLDQLHRIILALNYNDPEE